LPGQKPGEPRHLVSRRPQLSGGVEVVDVHKETVLYLSPNRLLCTCTAIRAQDFPITIEVVVAVHLVSLHWLIPTR